MATPPNIANYRIGAGIVTYTDDNTSGDIDLGNCPSFVLTPDIQTKEHFSSRTPIRTKDVTRITQLGVKVKMTLEEITAQNLAFFALSDIESSTAGDDLLRGLSRTTFTGTLTLTGTNSVGAMIDWVGRVSFVPAGDFELIGATDDYTSIEVEADVLVDDDGNYGVWTVRYNAGDTA